MFSKILKIIPTMAAGYIAYKFVDSAQREHDIKTKEEITHCEDLVKDSSEFEEIDKPIHGTLSSSYVRHKNTGNMYVKKGAHSREDMIKEFMISNALHEIREEQPECLIMQTNNGNGFQYHTLSRKFPNTHDVEEFVRQGRIDELKKKKVVGLEDSLVTDQIFGKQSDTKLANMVVRDDKDKLVFTTIDHERAVTPTGFSFFNPTTPMYPKNKSTLIRSIHDLGERSDDNHAGLAGDPRAKEFGEMAENAMDNKEIGNYYKKVATTNFSHVIEQCNKLAKSSNNSLARQSDCVGYQLFFNEMQKKAYETIERIERENNSPKF